MKYMIDCEGLGRALSLAQRILDCHVTAMEVRPVHDSVDMTLNYSGWVVECRVSSQVLLL